ncbi:hypothetical protein [Petroclostridium sp. X23]|uniref:hypothetical protein n=1 Tax=Petroclostridium sp. X23 TaxID=3045146 RepID=UPI0024ACED62|nr:hypothetical protein [Petroclostridium sp. X23]WHH56934.1 hypothetical protein QKW49_13860 [Petroclostridium sp. X23]
MGKPTTALLIPYTFVDISSTIAFGLMTFHFVAHFINVLKGAKPQGNEEGMILEI